MRSNCTTNWIICSTVLICLFVLYIIIRVGAKLQSVNGLLFKPLQVDSETLKVRQAVLRHRPESQRPRALALFCTELITLVSALFFLANLTTAHQGASKSILSCSIWKYHQAGRTCHMHPTPCAVEMFGVAEVQGQ